MTDMFELILDLEEDDVFGIYLVAEDIKNWKQSVAFPLLHKGKTSLKVPKKLKGEFCFFVEFSVKKFHAVLSALQNSAQLVQTGAVFAPERSRRQRGVIRYYFFHRGYGTKPDMQKWDREEVINNII